jgi:chromosome partitioning protein
MALNVLLIDDDSSTSDSIALMLRAEGLACDAVGTGAEGVAKGEQNAYDIILLDLMLPDMTGYEVLRHLRGAQIATPVIILSGLGELDNKVVGLGSGADDYLTKPIERRELIARIGAHVRRSMGHMSGLAGGPGADDSQLLAKKGAASPWSFDMSYVPPETPELMGVGSAGGHKLIALPAPGAVSRAPAATPRFERPYRDTTAPCHIVVLGNEKGGSGKSTTAMHVIGSLLAGGRHVACIDLDLRQQTLGRYLENRRAFAAAKEIALPMPDYLPLNIAQEDGGALDALIADAVQRADFLVIDSPGSATALSRAAHAWADTLITPLNDSFVDLDVLGRIDEAAAEVVDLGPYAELVDTARESKSNFSPRPLDWIVLRNRLAPRDTRNTRKMTDALVLLARRLGFRGAPGLTDRLIFRELFATGLTLTDLPTAGIGQGLTMSHVAARQELRALFDTLKLEPRDAEAEAKRAASAGRLIRRLGTSA